MTEPSIDYRRLGETVQTSLQPWMERLQAFYLCISVAGFHSSPSTCATSRRKPVVLWGERAQGIWMRAKNPTKPATHSNRKPATNSDLKPAGVPI